MPAKEALKTFTARLIRHFDHLRSIGVLDSGAHETFLRSVQLQAKDEIERLDGIPDDASPLAKVLLEELQSL